MLRFQAFAYRAQAADQTPIPKDKSDPNQLRHILRTLETPGMQDRCPCKMSTSVHVCIKCTRYSTAVCLTAGRQSLMTVAMHAAPGDPRSNCCSGAIQQQQHCVAGTQVLAQPIDKPFCAMQHASLPDLSVSVGVLQIPQATLPYLTHP